MPSITEGLARLEVRSSSIKGVEEKAARQREKARRQATPEEVEERRRQGPHGPEQEDAERWYRTIYRPREEELQGRHEFHRRQSELPFDDLPF